jgi:hypothetical protein
MKNVKLVTPNIVRSRHDATCSTKPFARTVVMGMEDKPVVVFHENIVILKPNVTEPL